VGLTTLLSRFPGIEVVGEAGSAKAALAEITRTAPDVVLMDLRLPDGSGLDVCRQLRSAEHPAKVLVLTSFGDDDLVAEAIAAGVEGYLLKEIDGARLVEAIEQVAAGQSILDPAVTRRVMNRLTGQSASAEAQSPGVLLSSQEKRVLALVAEGKTNKEVAAVLGLSDKTVKNYMSHVLDKLKLARRAQAAVFYARHLAR
jgi:DNA-binding NarL/FixJ family response regulator